jgi:magnesium transporter
VGEDGVLIDDIRIRNFLLAPLTAKVSDIMDYRYVALKAADSQQSAVQIFKEKDRKALPVMDSAGELIGIVTIDDVLNVAEEAATREIQKIGGSEALDEPYMQISFAQLVKKRAGWLIILFVGEMLTATAMGEKDSGRSCWRFRSAHHLQRWQLRLSGLDLVIRALALGEVKLREWARGAARVVSGLALGGILGAIGFCRIALWSLSNIWPTPATGRADGRTALNGIVLWGRSQARCCLHPAAPWVRPRLLPPRLSPRSSTSRAQDLLQCGSGDLTARSSESGGCPGPSAALRSVICAHA